MSTETPNNNENKNETAQQNPESQQTQSADAQKVSMETVESLKEILKENTEESTKINATDLKNKSKENTESLTELEAQAKALLIERGVTIEDDEEEKTPLTDDEKQQLEMQEKELTTQEEQDKADREIFNSVIETTSEQIEACKEGGSIHQLIEKVTDEEKKQEYKTTLEEILTNAENIKAKAEQGLELIETRSKIITKIQEQIQVLLGNEEKSVEDLEKKKVTNQGNTNTATTQEDSGTVEETGNTKEEEEEEEEENEQFTEDQNTILKIITDNPELKEFVQNNSDAIDWDQNDLFFLDKNALCIHHTEVSSWFGLNKSTKFECKTFRSTVTDEDKNSICTFLNENKDTVKKKLSE